MSTGRPSACFTVYVTTSCHCRASSFQPSPEVRAGDEAGDLGPDVVQEAGDALLVDGSVRVEGVISGTTVPE